MDVRIEATAMEAAVVMTDACITITRIIGKLLLPLAQRFASFSCSLSSIAANAPNSNSLIGGLAAA